MNSKNYKAHRCIAHQRWRSALLAVLLFIAPLQQVWAAKRALSTMFDANYIDATLDQQRSGLEHGLGDVREYKRAKQQLKGLTTDQGYQVIERDHLIPSAAYNNITDSDVLGTGKTYTKLDALTIIIPFEMHESLLSTGNSATLDVSRLDKLASISSIDVNGVATAQQYKDKIGNLLADNNTATKCQGIKLAVADYIYALKHDDYSWSNIQSIDSRIKPTDQTVRNRIRDAVADYIDHSEVNLGSYRSACKANVLAMWNAEL